MLLLPACSDYEVAGKSESVETETETAPPVPIVSISPASPRTDDVLTAVIAEPDPELSYTYAWSVDGADAGIATETVPPAATTRDETWTVTVNAGGDPGSASVVIANTPPGPPALAFEPAAPLDPDAIVCAIAGESEDADLDPIAYEWSWRVDGVDAALSERSVDATRTAPGEEWACTVTPTDGTDRGEPATASVVVGACGPSLDFDGADDGVELPWVPAAATYEVWIQGAPVAFSEVLGTNCGDLWWHDAGFTVEVYPSCSGTSSRHYGSLDFTAWPSGWYHLAMVVVSATEVHLYVDGARVGSPSMVYDGGVVGVFHGGVGALYSVETPGGYLNARMRLAAARISSIPRYTADFTPEWPLGADADASVLYTLEEAGGATLIDHSGNAHDGTIHDATWTTAGPPCD